MKVTFWKRKLFKNYHLALKQFDRLPQTTVFPKKIALVVHVFYPYIFKEIMDMIARVESVRISLYLTGPAEVREESIKMIPESVNDYIFFEYENHGRDIFPFLQILPKVFDDGHNLVLKLHTKGSNHLNRKEHWRNELFSNLLSNNMVEKAIDIFNSNPSIGIIGPQQNILPMKLYYSSNGLRVKELGNRMGLTDNDLSDLNFVAGSMFYAQKDALSPMLKLNLQKDDFEPETGQTDGTMAHGVERAFTTSCLASGLQLADTGYHPSNPYLTVNKINYFII